MDWLESEARAGWEAELGWTARVRGALTALLRALDREPVVRRLVCVDALTAGPRVLASRARVMEQLAGVVDLGRTNARASGRLPRLVAEGVVGATFAVVHARLLARRPEPLLGLLNELMAVIVLPYRGSAGAARELERPLPRPPAGQRDRNRLARRPLEGTVSPVDYRLTPRAGMALMAVAGGPGLSNREVSEAIGLADEGQVSRIMKRLVEQGLVENAQTHAKRLARAWRLTADGEAVAGAHRDERHAGGLNGTQPRTSTTGQLPESGRRGKEISQAGPDFLPADKPANAGRPGENLRVPHRVRLTVLTHHVLSAVAELSADGHNPSNREIARAAGVKDEGQISKLLSRLVRQGLLWNTAGETACPNAWRLTPRGAKLVASVSVKNAPSSGGRHVA
ncbi:MAG: MarR family transcriptional regulator [Solirubrobacteraceae bacterium]